MNKCFMAVVLSILALSFSVTVYAQGIDPTIFQEHYQILHAPVFSQLSDEAFLLENREEAREKPPLSAFKISEEILAGIGGGILAAIATGVVIEAVDVDSRAFKFCTVSGAWVFGSGGAVYLIGNMDGQTGSFPATMLGAVAGFGILAASTALDAYFDIDLYDEHGNIWIAVALVSLFVPSTGATIGFNLTRRYDSSTAESEAAPMSFAVPVACSKPDPLRIDLLRVRF